MNTFTFVTIKFTVTDVDNNVEESVWRMSESVIKKIDAKISLMLSTYVYVYEMTKNET